jgi:hypothetical protein
MIEIGKSMVQVIRRSQGVVKNIVRCMLA